MKLLRILLITAGAVFLIWFLLPFFTRRILNIGNVTGMIVSLLMILYGIFFQTVNALIKKILKFLIGKIVLCALGLALAAILVLAIMCIICMYRGISSSQRAEPGATVIVLGCKVYGDRASLMLTERLEAALAYLVENPESSCIVSGGKGADETVTEASVMFSWLTEKGIEENRIYIEDRSKNTRENIACSETIIREYGFPESVAIATNDFHEYRAIRIAKAAGLSAVAIPGKTAWWLLPTFLVREMYGILEDWFLN